MNGGGKDRNIPCDYPWCLSSLWVRAYSPAGESGARLPSEGTEAVYDRQWGLSLGVLEEAALYSVPEESLPEADWRAIGEVPWADPEDRPVAANCHWGHDCPLRQGSVGPFGER